MQWRSRGAAAAAPTVGPVTPPTGVAVEPLTPLDGPPADVPPTQVPAAAASLPPGPPSLSSASAAEAWTTRASARIVSAWRVLMGRVPPTPDEVQPGYHGPLGGGRLGRPACAPGRADATSGERPI